MKKTFSAPILVEVTNKPNPTKLGVRIENEILPAEQPEQIKNIEYKFNVEVLPIEINISEPLIFTANEFLQNNLDLYVDKERDLKTLLNYGNDKQSVALAYRTGPLDDSGLETIQLKLLQPVPDDIALNTPVFLSREIAKSVIDKVRIKFAPDIDNTPYLRPKNLKVKADLDTGKFVRNVTLNKISLSSGSVGITDQYQNKTFEDQIFRQWYSYDFNSSELNIDFTNYENFVFYSSAAMRLASFRQKLQEIEKLEVLRKQFSTNYATTASAAVLMLQNRSTEYALQKEDIIRSFDRYEQHLYFTSGTLSPYSASFDYVDGGVEYNFSSYWPKSGSGLWPVSSVSASNWYATQSAIAQRFDEFNENNLVNTIPSYLQGDENSLAYITFVSMVGQLFDNIKLYIDQFPNIYSRNLDPNKELSKDLVNEIAEAFGFKVPTIDSVYNLTDNILGTNTSTPRRDLATEIYKRLLHNLPFFAKAKGTKTALESFLKTFGITPQLLSVKETGTPVTSSYQVFDEYTTGLDFDETSTKLIRIPILASGRSPSTMSLQLNFTAAKSKTMTVITGDNKWALNVEIHPTNSTLGRLQITSGSLNTSIITSSYYPIFGDELLNLAIKNYNNTSSFYFTQVDGEDIVFSQIIQDTNKFSGLWNSSLNIDVGGSGDRVISRYDGTIDEIRLWGIPLSDEVILNTAFDPASNAGDTYSDAADDLYVQVSFNNVDTSTLASNIIKNESPYKNKSVSPSLENLFCFNLTSADFSRYNRTIKQYIPQVGTTAHITSKIVVADPPKFISDSKGLRLYRNKSIVAPEQKIFNKGRNKVILAMTPTDIVNQNIIRNLGLENINAVLGSPTTLYTTFEKSLTILKNHYQQYHYVDVETNKFIRILSDLNSVLTQVVDYFIPSRATVLKGIVIEPNILEQVKIPPVKNIRFYGKNTRKTTDAANSLTGSNADYGVTFNVSKIINVRPEFSSSYQAYKAKIDTIVTDITASVNQYKTTIGDHQTLFDLNQGSQYQAYNLQHLSWKEYNTVSSSNAGGLYKPWPKQKLDVGFSEKTILTGSYNTFTSSFNGLIEVVNADSKTYDLQHLTWKEYDKIINRSFSGSSPRPKQKLNVGYSIDKFISSSFLRITSSIDIINPKTSLIKTDYKTYDLQNLSWEEYKNFVTSSLSGSAVWEKQKIDLELHTLNKIGYNDTNNGSPGAEPYNRLYARKLFIEEIDTTRLGGVTSIYTPALYDIPPSADFRDFGVYTYFNNEEGIYYFNEIKKIPAYQTPLNAVWNFSSQSFGNTATTWSYGVGYNKNDVVYQEVTEQTLQIDNIFGTITGSSEFLQTKTLVKSARAGNGRYYVFKTRPEYGTSVTEDAFYSGSVPSYIPPSLDRTNWDLLRFKPVQVRSPRRVVFDTYTISDPILNNFKTTTISVDKNINIPDRYIDSFDVGNLAINSYLTGEMSLQNLSVLFAIQASIGGIRLRLYRTQEAREIDFNRNFETRPTGSHGVLLDTNLTGTNVVEISNPIPTLVAGDSPSNGKIYYTLNNLETITKSNVNILLYYFALEIEPRIPKGYLRKHYRFFRDNSTATKRRNYLGCKNTQETTIDGLPPIQIFISEGTEITVSSTSGNEEIITGGGGTLNVT